MFSELPLELLSQIFSYLPLSDRLQCNLVCKHWHWAFLDPKLHDDQTILKFEEDEHFLASITNSATCESSLLESEVTTAVRHLLCDKLNVNIFSVRPLVDWIPVLARLKHLTLSEANIVSESELVVLLKSLRNLNGLAINNARDVFISGGFLATQEDKIEVRNALANVTVLDLSSNSPYLTDQLFNRITGCMPNVVHFVLENTKILNHAGIYKKHYPVNSSSATELDSPSVLTWRNILRCLEKNAPHLQSVSFYNSGISAIGLKDLGHVQGLCLKSINVGKCLDISTEALIDFCQHQPNLAKLNIDGCRKILTDNLDLRFFLFEILSRSIKVLSMKGLSCPRIENSFEILDKLTFLDASECDFPSNHLFNGLQNNEAKKSLQTLKLNSFGISSSSDAFLRLIPDLTGLTTLALRNGHEGINDNVVQTIIVHCHNLNNLDLSNCGQLTDSAFVHAKNIDAQEQTTPTETSSKIFLGSRAEAELLCEIKRIQYINSASSTGKLGQMNGLRHLRRIAMENVRITEATLKYAFKFDDLRHVNLSLCKSIADEGFRYLADQNPHLETLIAKQCNLNGETVLYIAEKCPRLKKLDVEACLSITNESMRKLPSVLSKRGAPNLQFIDLSFCSKVRTATIEKILMKEIPSLRHVGMRGLALAELLDESDSSDDGNENRIPVASMPTPPPPPPPSFKP